MYASFKLKYHVRIVFSSMLNVKLNEIKMQNFNVLDKTLKGIRCVRPDNRKVLRAPGPRTKYFERLFLWFKFKYRSVKIN